MHLTAAGVARGFCNQRSAMLSALYLASMLQWDVVLPRIYSPEACENMSPLCYKYTKFEEFSFDVFYDVTYFSEFVKHEYGIHTYLSTEHLPQAYQHAEPHNKPCARGLCRGTYDDLYAKYSRVRGPFIVHGPGIASGFINSEMHFHGVQLANTAFHPSAKIAAEGLRRVARIVSSGKLTVALHWRFELDVRSKVTPLVNEDVFTKAITTSLEKHHKNPRGLIFYIAGGESREEIDRHVGLHTMIQHFHKGEIYGSSMDEMSNVTFLNAAIDLFVSAELDVFFGHSFSSFSGFIAAARHIEYKHNHLVPSFMKYGCEILNTVDTLTHWQYELTLPVQHCYVPDPCQVFYQKVSPLHQGSSAWDDLRKGCVYKRSNSTSMNLAHSHTSGCTGMTNLWLNCRTR